MYHLVDRSMQTCNLVIYWSYCYSRVSSRGYPANRPGSPSSDISKKNNDRTIVELGTTMIDAYRKSNLRRSGRAAESDFDGLVNGVRLSVALLTAQGRPQGFVGSKTRST